MIETLLLILLILDSFVLVASILLQSGKGSGMAASFGGVSSSPDAFIGTRQAGNLLTKIGWWSGGIFLGIAFLLQILSTRARTPKSVLDQSLAPPTAPNTTAPSPTAPALPFQSAPATPANPATGAGAPATPKPGGAVPLPANPSPSTTKPPAKPK